MALILTEDETMIADSARRLIERKAPISEFRKLRDSKKEARFDSDLLYQLAEHGLVAPNISEADGGVDLGAVVAGVVVEQAAHMLAAAPLISAAISAQMIDQLGSKEQKSRWLPALMAGDSVIAAAIEEQSRHDPSALSTTATKTGTGWTIEGRKVAVIDGVGASVYLVSALLDSVPRIFAVPAGAPGLNITQIDSVDSRNLAIVELKNVSSEPLGGEASTALREAFDLGRSLLAAELLGISDEAFERTISYLKEREQFGRRIGSFQALQHRAARLYARLDLARGTVLKSLRAIDEADPDATMIASLAKAVMTELARDVLAEAVQMHGGIGVTDEFDIGLFFKRARVAGDLLGDDNFHLERLAIEHWHI